MAERRTTRRSSSSSSGKPGGVLYVVATPIGNLDDLSPRARRVLDAVDLIAAEDTRRTRGLLSSIEVKSRLIAYHEHNEAQQAPGLVARLRGGESIALVSDAGAPLLSDPGLVVVRAAHEAGIPVVSVPGPSALTAALSVAGLATDRFVFEGFLPRRSGQRRARLASLVREERTLVFYESVHRLSDTLAALEEHLGSDRHAVIGRELTKVHESLYEGTLGELRQRLGADADIPLKGEFVVMVAGDRDPHASDDVEVARVFGILAEEVPARTAVALTVKITGASRNRVYALTRGVTGGG